jgi:large subunit ribosomal protein L30
MSSDKKITVVQTGSAIGRPERQRRTLLGLGLTHIGRSRELADTPAVRGMVAKVAHLVKIVGEK